MSASDLLHPRDLRVESSPDAPDAVPDSDVSDGVIPDSDVSDSDVSDSDVSDSVVPDSVVTIPDLGGSCAGSTCPLGCNSSVKRCYRLKPTGATITASDYAAATGKLSFVYAPGATHFIDTDTGEVVTGSTTLHPANTPGASGGVVWRPSLLSSTAPLLIVDRLTIPPGVDVVLHGSQALRLYVRSEASIEGRLKLDADTKTPGPGGYEGGSSDGKDGKSCAGGEGSGGKHSSGSLHVEFDSGGGGAALGAAGGVGGDGKLSTLVTVTGGDGGAPFASATTFHGGCGGGAGGGPDRQVSPPGHGGQGGAGGGALQLTVNATLKLTGAISANGGGGGGGGVGAGGGGGGSGGTIVVEALDLALGKGAFLAANGGGGGSAGSRSREHGEAGDNGSTSTTPAHGGAATSYGGAGGEGGALKTGQGQGQAGEQSYNGGGGGGGVGRIVLRSLHVPSTTGHCSPAPTTSTTLEKW